MKAKKMAPKKWQHDARWSYPPEQAPTVGESGILSSPELAQSLALLGKTLPSIPGTMDYLLAGARQPFQIGMDFNEAPPPAQTGVRATSMPPQPGQSEPHWNYPPLDWGTIMQSIVQQAQGQPTGAAQTKKPSSEGITQKSQPVTTMRGAKPLGPVEPLTKAEEGSAPPPDVGVGTVLSAAAPTLLPILGAAGLAALVAAASKKPEDRSVPVSQWSPLTGSMAAGPTNYAALQGEPTTAQNLFSALPGALETYQAMREQQKQQEAAARQEAFNTLSYLAKEVESGNMDPEDYRAAAAQFGESAGPMAKLSPTQKGKTFLEQIKGIDYRVLQGLGIIPGTTPSPYHDVADAIVKHPSLYSAETIRAATDFLGDPSEASQASVLAAIGRDPKLQKDTSAKALQDYLAVTMAREGGPIKPSRNLSAEDLKTVAASGAATRGEKQRVQMGTELRQLRAQIKDMMIADANDPLIPELKAQADALYNRLYPKNGSEQSSAALKAESGANEHEQKVAKYLAEKAKDLAELPRASVEARIREQSGLDPTKGAIRDALDKIRWKK